MKLKHLLFNTKAGVGAGCAGVLLVALVAGCATQRQVEEAVARSNAAILTAGGLGALGAGPGGTNGWPEAAARLENLIAEQGDNPSLAAALRLRQAVLYLHARQFNLAEAAFEEVDLGDLHTSRDRALKRLEGPLVWWYAVADQPFRAQAVSGGRSDFVQATNALGAISAEWDQLNAPADQDLRDYLAALRAFIQVKLANEILGTEAARHHLATALNVYAAMLPPGETERWRTVETNWPPAQVTAAVAVLPKLRRRFEAEAVLAGARAAVTNNAIPGPFGVTNGYLLRALTP